MQRSRAHFEDKESPLTAVAAEAWERLAERAALLAADPGLSAREKLREMLAEILAVGREQPHLYRLMHKPPAAPDVLRAAGRTQDPFIAVLGELVGDTRAHLYGAVLMTSLHGIIGMEASGQLTRDKWRTDGDEILGTLVAGLPVG